MTDARPTLNELNAMVAECDRHHYFYHYKSSYQHLCFAETLRAQGDLERAREHYKAALFQDHQNKYANNWETRNTCAAYDAHVRSGAIDALAAYEATLGWERDTSMDLCAKGGFEQALKVSGARHDAYHKHASSAHVSRGEYYMRKGELDLAIADFSKALDLWRENAVAAQLREECRERRREEEKV